MWPSREDIAIGAANIIKEPLVDRERIILAPHRNNLGPVAAPVAVHGRA